MSPELPLTSMPGDDEENLHRAIQLAAENPRVGGSIDCLTSHRAPRLSQLPVKRRLKCRVTTSQAGNNLRGPVEVFQLFLNRPVNRFCKRYVGNVGNLIGKLDGLCPRRKVRGMFDLQCLTFVLQ